MESQGHDTLRKWLKEGDVADAIFAVNDLAAIGAMQAIEEAGLQIGKDVAIVGAGNIHYSDMLRVPLTTVSWSRSEMGQQAARLLIQLINGEAPTAKKQKVILPPELIIRASCGAQSANQADGKFKSKLKRVSYTQSKR